MSKDNTPTIVTTEDNSTDIKKTLLDNFSFESFQKYILGYKKNGSPRSIYDVIVDFQKTRRKKKKKKSKDDDCVIYFPTLTKNKKKKKKKKK